MCLRDNLSEGGSLVGVTVLYWGGSGKLGRSDTFRAGSGVCESACLCQEGRFRVPLLAISSNAWVRAAFCFRESALVPVECAEAVGREGFCGLGGSNLALLLSWGWCRSFGSLPSGVF